MFARCVPAAAVTASTPALHASLYAVFYLVVAAVAASTVTGGLVVAVVEIGRHLLIGPVGGP